jgi:hypothetical protein
MDKHPDLKRLVEAAVTTLGLNPGQCDPAHITDDVMDAIALRDDCPADLLRLIEDGDNQIWCDVEGCIASLP